MPEVLLSKILVSDVYKLIVNNPSVIKVSAYFEEVLLKMIENHKTRHVYVVNDDLILKGSIKFSNVIEYMFPYSAFGYSVDIKKEGLLFYQKSIIAADVMNSKPSFVYEDTSLQEAVQIMNEKKIGELPVVDKYNHLIGEINLLEVITYYVKIKERGDSYETQKSVKP